MIPMAYLVNGLEGLPEGPLTESRSLKVRTPQKVRIAEDQFDGPRRYDAIRPSDNSSRLYNVANYLCIQSPIARVVKDEDSLYLCAGKVYSLIEVRVETKDNWMSSWERTLTVALSSGVRS